MQEIRTYYDFLDIDIDRYTIDGALRQVMLAARELQVDQLPDSSRTWINEKLIYTHGYGLTMNLVNGFTPEGLPDLLLRDMPVLSTKSSLKVTRPEIYFGEATDTDVYVKTRQQEFNYPQGSPTASPPTRAAAASSSAGAAAAADRAGARGHQQGAVQRRHQPESRLLMRRSVNERVGALAPFLTFDADP